MTGNRKLSAFSILHVCTGNIGRSPMAEMVMREQLKGRLRQSSDEFVVASAGTWGCAGSSMEPFALLALGTRGITPGEFVARELTAAMLQDADLVLTATAEHRAHVVGMLPSAVRRTFTLKEFARIARSFERLEPALKDLPSAARDNVQTAGRLRGVVDRPGAGSDDVDDPLGAPVGVYESRANEIELACSQAIDLLLSRRH